MNQGICKAKVVLDDIEANDISEKDQLPSPVGVDAIATGDPAREASW